MLEIKVDKDLITVQNEKKQKITFGKSFKEFTISELIEEYEKIIKNWEEFFSVSNEFVEEYTR